MEFARDDRVAVSSGVGVRTGGQHDLVHQLSADATVESVQIPDIVVVHGRRQLELQSDNTAFVTLGEQVELVLDVKHTDEGSESAACRS